MSRAIIYIITALFLFSAHAVMAKTLYTWTDKGVRMEAAANLVPISPKPNRRPEPSKPTNSPTNPSLKIRRRKLRSKK